MNGTPAAHGGRTVRAPSLDVFARRRRRALTLIVKLNKLSKSFPEFRPILAAPVENLNHQADRSPRSDRRLVYDAIITGAWTINELRDETLFTREQLRPILELFLRKKLITTSTRDKKDTVGGRPETLYRPR